MTRHSLFALLLLLGSLAHTPAIADSNAPCLFKGSSVNIQKIRNSSLVAGFEQLERQSRYAGHLKGIGGFHLQLYRCSHDGAMMTIIVGPEDNASGLQKALKILPDLLFPKEQSTLVADALGKLSIESLGEMQYMQDLAEDLGLNDIRIQLSDIEGIDVLTFSFHEGN